MADDIRPDPDPTRLTEAASARLEVWLRRETDQRFAAFRDLADERRLVLRAEIAALANLTDSRFSDAQHALGLALANFKDIIARLESQLGKQIDAQSLRQEDLRSIVQDMSGSRKGSTQTLGWVIGSAGVLVAIMTAIMSAVHFLPR